MDRTAGKRSAAHSSPSNWRVPALLVALSLIPVVAGAVRVGGLTGNPTVTSENARFVSDPVPMILHIVSASVWCLLGAFQVSAAIRRRSLRWHRSAGRVLAPLGLVAALTGLWMTLLYPRAEFDGPLLDLFRFAAGAGMTASIVLGIVAIRRRDIAAHGAWMTRAYALGLGVGTQVLTHIPWFVFPEIQGELSRALCMGAGWAINVAAAEWIIRRRATARAISAVEEARQPKISLLKKGHVMNRFLAVLAVLSSSVVSAGCARHLTDFSVISTRSNMLDDASKRGEKVTGMDCVPVVLVQWGEPDLQAAIEKAIESAGPGYDALVDGAVYLRYENFFFGRNCWKVEGTAVSRGSASVATVGIE